MPSTCIMQRFTQAALFFTFCWSIGSLEARAAVGGSFQDDKTPVERAYALRSEGKYLEAAQLFEKLSKESTATAPLLYNAACSFSLAGEKNDAFRALRASIEAGFRDVDHLKADPDFKSLYEDGRWTTAVMACEQKLVEFKASIQLPKVREELLRRVEADQRVRTQQPPNRTEWERVDVDNMVYMKKMIDEHHWLGSDLVGEDGAQAAWLMIQHCDRDLAFQKLCLERLEEAFRKGLNTGPQLALLTDRVLMHEGKDQRYGSQFVLKDGELQPHPIEDRENLDERRKEMGLQPFAEYEELIRSLQNSASKNSATADDKSDGK